MRRLPPALVLCALMAAGCNGTTEVESADADTGAQQPDGGAPAAAPLANAGPDQVVLRGQKVMLNGSGSRSRTGQDILIEWHQVSGISVGLSNNSNPTPSFAAPPEAGDIVFEIMVSDPGGSDHDVATVRVAGTAGVQAPLASAGGDITMPPGGTVQASAAASLALTGGGLAYLWNDPFAQGFDIVNPTAPAPSVKAPSIEAAGVLRLEVAENDLWSAPDHAGVNVSAEAVSAVVAPPVMVKAAELYVTPQTPVDLTGITPEPGYEEFRWSQVANDPVEIKSGVQQTASITAPLTAGNYIFAFKARKGPLWSPPAFVQVHAWAGEGVSIPVAEAGDDINASPLSTVTLDGGLSTVDPKRLAELAFRWEQTGGSAAALSDPTSPAPTFKAPKVFDTLSFQLTVSDGVVWSAPDTVIVHVGTM